LPFLVVLAGFFLGLVMSASDMAMAMACLRDLTTGPSLLPEWSSPLPYSRITLLTFFCALEGFLAAMFYTERDLPHTVVGFAEILGFGEVEGLEAEVAQGVEGVVYAEIFVGEARAGGVGEGAEGFD